MMRGEGWGQSKSDFVSRGGLGGWTISFYLFFVKLARFFFFFKSCCEHMMSLLNFQGSFNKSVEEGLIEK